MIPIILRALGIISKNLKKILEERETHLRKSRPQYYCE